MTVQPAQRGWPRSRTGQIIAGTIVVALFGFGGWAGRGWVGAAIGVVPPLVIWARYVLYNDVDPDIRHPISVVSPGRVALDIAFSAGIAGYFWMCYPWWLAVLGIAFFALTVFQRGRALLQQRNED